MRPSVVLCLLPVCALSQTAVPVVPAPWGTVRGVALEGREGRKMNAYLGIPYALPPTGPLRFLRPQPHPGPGEGKEFVADTWAPACPQERFLIGSKTEMSEDCLTLNVYVPTKVSSPRPVMVYIHGGALFLGEASSYRPFKLAMNGNVIVVTVQYRLAALGFLSTGDKTLPGNMGLWDQNLALQWVKDNIGAFGGDPGRVTLFGHSAGSWSTGLHIVSPHSKGLFRRAVMQSGSPQTAVYYAAEERAAFEGVSAKLGCTDKNDRKVLECWRTKTADEIIRKSAEWGQETGNPQHFGARIDGDFIPRDPVDLVTDEQYVQEKGLGNIDIIIGFANREGATLALAFGLGDPALLGQIDRMVFLGFVDEAVTLFNEKESNEPLNKVVEFFYRKADYASNTSVPLDLAVDLETDSTYAAPSFQWLRPLAARHHKGRRYMYMFEHEFSFNENTIKGSHHNDEVVVEFDVITPEDSTLYLLNKTTEAASPEDHQLGDLFVSIITAFAATGDPNPALKETLGSDWPEFTTEDEAVLSLTLSPRVLRDVMKDRIALWVKLIPDLKMDFEKQNKKKAPSEGSGKNEL